MHPNRPAGEARGQQSGQIRRQAGLRRAGNHIRASNLRIFHIAKSSLPIASLTISLGLLSIPVQLFSPTVPSERISFHLLCKSDGSRGKEPVVIIRANGNRLALRQLHFEGEMRKPEDFGRDATRVSEAEVNLARQLIDQLTTDRFDRDEFVD